MLDTDGVASHKKSMVKIMTNYQGVIIEESLESSAVLKDLRILSTKVEEVAEEHRTPWIKQWTLHTVEIPKEAADSIAERLSKVLERELCT